MLKNTTMAQLQTQELDDTNRPSPGPLVTVVTPSFNQGHFIRETIESVLSQDYPHLEYLVMDGGSNDHTQDVLKSYGERLSWVSERDQGQADAVNKGFRQAKGEILGWLNSDDTYWPSAVRKVVQFFQANPDIGMVYGEAYNVDEQGKIIERSPTEEFDYQRLAETCFICQPSAFIRRRVFEEVGPLDVTLHYCLDYEYWMRIGKQFRVAHIDELLATSRLHGAAKTFLKRRELHQEIVSTVQRHYALVPLRTIYLYTYVTLMEKFMPNVLGLYPNGWATSHVSIFLRSGHPPFSHLLIQGYANKNQYPLKLQVTAGGKTVVRDIAAPGTFSLREELGVVEEIRIGAETSGEGYQCVTAPRHAWAPEEPPFSYRLDKGCCYSIRNLTFVGDAGRQKVMFSKQVAFIFFAVLPIAIVRNSLLINRRVSFREQFKTVWKLCRTVLGGVTAGRRASIPR
jgi:glycosyltransferase involved in cell wall biosynthesis